MRTSTTNIVTAITKKEHDILVALRGRSLTADPMRCSMSTEAAPDMGEPSDLEQLMARRLLNNR